MKRMMHVGSAKGGVKNHRFVVDGDILLVHEDADETFVKRLSQRDDEITVKTSLSPTGTRWHEAIKGEG